MTLSTLGITLDQARAVIAGTLAAGHEQGFNPLTVVVLDAGGHVTAVEREDGSSTKRFEIAHGKAHGAVAFGWGSRRTMGRAEDFAPFVTGVAVAIGALVPVPGGVLIRDADGEPARRGRRLRRQLRQRREGRAGRHRVGRAGRSGGLSRSPTLPPAGAINGLLWQLWQGLAVRRAVGQRF